MYGNHETKKRTDSKHLYCSVYVYLQIWLWLVVFCASLFFRFPCPEHYCCPVDSMYLAGNATRLSVWAHFASGCMCHWVVLPAVYVPVYPLLLGTSTCFITWRKHRWDNQFYLQISVVSYIIYKVCFTFWYSRCCCCLSFWNICQLSFFIICRKSSVWLLHGSRAQPSHWRLWLEVFLWTETWINRLGKSHTRCLQPYVCMCIRFLMFLKIVILTKARFDQKCSTQLHGEILL